MRRRALPGLIVFLATLLNAVAIAAAIPSAVPSPYATDFTLELMARMSAERSETFPYTLFLNVTSGGPLQLVRVNLSVESELAVLALNASSPSACTLTASNVTFVEWQCNFLRPGSSNRWTIPATVVANASVGRFRTASAAALELGGGPATPRESTVQVWIVAVVLRISIQAFQAATVHPADKLDFVVNVTNFNDTQDPAEIPSVTAYFVVLTLRVSPGLNLVPPARHERPSLSPQSSMYVNFTAFVRTDAAIGNPVWINATVAYRDVSNHSVGPRIVEFPMHVALPNPLPLNAATAVAVLAFALLAILAAVLIAPAMGERNLRIDEVFLVHRSGILIQHLSRGPRLKKDDDLVASMFVAIQEFVRDSFHTKATLDEFSFAGRKAAVLRGTHIVLAVLISRGSAVYLFPQMKAVEEALEKAHGPDLQEWDGRVSRLDQALPILEAFLRGDYRQTRGWWK